MPYRCTDQKLSLHYTSGFPTMQCASSLEDGRRSRAAQAARRVERVDAEELVDQAAGDAEHGRAAVLALGVQLERLRLRVVVAHPRDVGDVADLTVVLRLGEREVASLEHARRQHDLQPAHSRDRLE